MERPDLAQELTRLATEDLLVRERLAATGALFNGYHPEMRSVHRRNGDRLSSVLDELRCWPGYRLIGQEGSEAAFLIAQHDIANPDLIRRTYRLYEAAVAVADADPRRLANLEDRIRYFEGRPQWYGTHLGWNRAGEFGPWPPIADPETVDERRIDLGLTPLAEALKIAAANRPSQRSVDDVLAEHRRADDFAREVGWRGKGADPRY